MKKRILSLILAAITVLSAVSFSFSASAANDKAVFNYYSKKGSHKVSTFTFTVSDNDFTYKVWYPKDIAKLGKRPIILYCNGTGSNYTMKNLTSEIMKRSASFGYVCLTNTDENTGTGASMDAGMTKLIEYNKNPKSKLYKKLNLNKVGIAGHSQGATCTMNLSDPAQYKNSKYYKAIFAASLPSQALAASELQNCPYNPKHVKKPTCLLAGTGITDNAFICPPEKSLKPNFKYIKSDVYTARMKDVEHADSFEKMYPYMLAWFDYQLYGKSFAAKAFTGKNPELKANPEWQDFKVKLTKKAISVKNTKAKKGAFAVSWTKVNTANGYKIEYATNKDFKNKKTVTVKGAAKIKGNVKKLKKRKYYVRVRAYTTVGRKNYCSKYSDTVIVKVK